MSYLSSACSGVALFFSAYVFLIAIVLGCQQSKPRTGQSGCDAVAVS